MKKLTKKERQWIDYNIPKCKCGNNLSLDRQAEGITVCPACEEPTLEERVTAIEDRLNQ